LNHNKGFLMIREEKRAAIQALVIAIDEVLACNNQVDSAIEKLHELENHSGIFLCSDHPQAYRDLIQGLSVAISDKKRIGVIGETLEERNFWIEQIQSSAQILKDCLSSRKNKRSTSNKSSSSVVLAFEKV